MVSAEGDKETSNMKKVFRCRYIFTLLVIGLAVCCEKPLSAQQNSPTANFIELLRLAETKTTARLFQPMKKCLSCEEAFRPTPPTTSRAVTRCWEKKYRHSHGLKSLSNLDFAI